MNSNAHHDTADTQNAHHRSVPSSLWVQGDLHVRPQAISLTENREAAKQKRIPTLKLGTGFQEDTLLILSQGFYFLLIF